MDIVVDTPRISIGPDILKLAAEIDAGRGKGTWYRL